MKAILVILLAFSLVSVGVGYNLPASSIRGNLNMTSHNVIGLAAPTNDTDAATKAYADSVAIGGGLATTGGTMTGQIDVGGFTVVNSTTPVNDSDLSTKKYVDDLSSVYEPINDGVSSYIPCQVLIYRNDTMYCAKTNNGTVVKAGFDASEVFNYVGASFNHSFIMPGEYKCGSTIDLSYPAQCRFEGAERQSTFISRNSSFTGDNLVVFDHADTDGMYCSSTFEHVTFYSASQSGTGVYVENVIWTPILTDCRIYGFSTGIRLGHYALCNSIADSYIRNCDIGVQIIGEANANTLRNCYIEHNDEIGLYIRDGARGNQYLGGTIEYNGNSALHGWWLDVCIGGDTLVTSGNVVRGTWIENNNAVILFGGSDNPYLSSSGNIITECVISTANHPNGAVYFYSGYRNMLINNIFLGYGNDSVVVDAHANGTIITGNVHQEAGYHVTLTDNGFDTVSTPNYWD